MGAVVNMRPDLFNAVIMGVPFVDVLTTMADETIPLTSIEWEEWGNPAVSLCLHSQIMFGTLSSIYSVLQQSLNAAACVLTTNYAQPSCAQLLFDVAGQGVLPLHEVIFPS